MNSEERARLVKATELCHRWHAEQQRKTTQIPYVSHLLQVEGLVLEHGGDSDQAIAALLHDSLEDAPDSEERALRETEIRARFGPRVLDIVLDCTDTGRDEFLKKKKAWKERKDRYLEQLRRAPARTHLVAACDKRHNLHAIVYDVKTSGPDVFDRFTATPSQCLWYYTSVIEILRSSLPGRLVDELDDLLEELRAQVAALDA
ncbi:MAG: HD domain-containing protein [Myxococcota bacterium]